MIHSRHLPPHWAFPTLLSSCMLYWSVIVWVMWLAGCHTGGVGGYWIRWVVIMTSLFCYCSHTYEDTSHTPSLLLVFTSCAHDIHYTVRVWEEGTADLLQPKQYCKFLQTGEWMGLPTWVVVLCLCVRMVWIPIVPHHLSLPLAISIPRYAQRTW